MRSRLFNFTGTLPQTTNEFATVFQASDPRESREKSLPKTIDFLARTFGIKGPISQLEDTYRLQENSKILTIYPSSDSFWYYDDNLFANDDYEQSKNIPNTKLARTIATDFLSQKKLLLPNCQLASHSFSTVKSQKTDNKITKNVRALNKNMRKERVERIEEYNTEIHLNFLYTLDNLPVFGPGAKTRVSLVDPETVSGVYHFWRNPVRTEEKRKLLSPEFALELFCKNPRFAELSENSAQVVITEMDYGYYAFPPREMQKYLLPVYRFRGSVSTERIPNYEFTLHMVSVRYTDNEVKQFGVDINQARSVVF